MKNKDKNDNKNKTILTSADRMEFKQKLEKSNLTTTPMSILLKGALDSDSRRIEDSSITNDVIDVAKTMHIKGKKGKVKISDIISKQLGDKYSELTKFNGYGFGISSFIKQARVNKFIESNLPKLATSCSLFVDDVCNGSNFGNEENFQVQYEFYENGALITDTERKTKMNKILEPEDLDILSTDVKKCSAIDREGFYSARRDGCSFIRIIPNSKVAKELYIKYVLKETKIKYATEKFNEDGVVVETIRPSSKESVGMINKFLNDIGLESINENTDMLTVLDKDIIRSIPKSLRKKTSTFKFLDLDGHDKYNVAEMNKSESFYSFAKRYLSGELHKVHSFETKYEVIKVDESKNESKELYEATPLFKYTVGAFDSVDTESILKDIFSDSGIRKEFSLESIDEKTDETLEAFDVFDKEILIKSSFEDIYNMNLTKLFSKKRSSRVSFFSTESMLEGGMSEEEKGGMLTPLERLTLNFVNHLTADETLANKYSVESNGVDRNTTDLITERQSNIEKRIEKLTDAALEEHKQYSRLDRMFANVKGETVEFIDNTNVHPIMAGDRLMGVYHMTLSTDDIQNLMMARNMIHQGSIGTTMTYNNVEVDDIDLDQTVGKVMFTDYIKPIIEKTISKDFIRENSDIAHVLLRLMEENDMSNIINKNNVDTSINSYNYTKVNFIPADEIIFYRNGSRGLGTSVFKKAEIPAHMAILLREEALSWPLFDGKGISFVTVPQGASDISGEVGMHPLLDQLDEFASLDRSSLRNMLTTNVSLTHKFFKYVKPDQASQDINVQTLDMPDFKIDQEFLMQLEQEARNACINKAEAFHWETSGLIGA